MAEKFFHGVNNEFSDKIKNLKSMTNEKFSLFFTNSTEAEVSAIMPKLNHTVFAQPATVPMSTILLTKGTDVFNNVSVTNANYIRNLGIFVSVKDGKILLEEDF